ncbi:alkaline phosphatase family protein [Bradyrhizobium sp. ARR65]|uniref:alkaline phosphatase family protein n=1 Tax=Bradyrhizobium sp. ARR65 TaxID=1040989 RepID=UPI000463E457|nr:alkaline phosphatase family protein [Bradyrhizobium sp. ARR65]
MLCSSIGLADDANRGDDHTETRTPIKHVVIIIPENRTFDNYFGTYPHAANIPGEQSWVGVPAPKFMARPDTPAVNGLTPTLLQDNPNRSLIAGPANPTRLGPADAYTCSNDNGYTAEQEAYDGGRLDRFPQSTSGGGKGCAVDGSTIMNYYDGNTVQALWNYAQHYSMSDNSFSTNYGPTVPGHANIVSGNTHGIIIHDPKNPAHPDTTGFYVNPADGSITLTEANLPGYLDDCGSGRTFEFTGKNVGDLLNEKNVTWGYFQGGFLPTTPATFDANGKMLTPAVCASQHVAHQVEINGITYDVQNPTITPGPDIHLPQKDYSTGVTPFMHYASTRNPHHLRPSSPAMIGKTDQANHQYDISDFYTALAYGSLPSVSYVKAPIYQYGHPGLSDPLTEQAFIVQVINALQTSSYWKDTAVIIVWDDSDGLYDHVMPPVLTQSATSADALFGTGNCGTPQPGADGARCGLGPRQPLLVISPWAKSNFVDHTVTQQASVLRFIEDNWKLGFIDGPVAPPAGTGSVDRHANSIANMFDFERGPNMHRLVLDPVTGAVVDNHDDHGRNDDRAGNDKRDN